MATAKRKPATLDGIIASVEALDLMQFQAAWNELDVLSSNTQVDAIQVDPAGISIEGSRFRGIAAVFVLLQYTEDDHEHFEETDSFIGKFNGHIEADIPVVDEFTVDTSPFFAGEELS